MSRGHIRRRGAAGSWEFIVDVGDQACRRCTGCGRRRWGTDAAPCGRCGGAMGAVVFERRQRSKSGYPRRRDAQAALTQTLRSVDTGGFTAPSELTVAEYLDEWLPTAKARLRAGAYDAVNMHIDVYVNPRVGGMPLRQLTSTRVKGLYAELRDSGRVRGGGGLSAKTVHNIHVTLNRALADAVDDGIIPRNPARGASVEPESPEQVVWDAGQLYEFLGYVKAHDPRGFPMWRTLAFTGLRRGELVGVRWSDVDLDRRVVSVVQQRAKGGGDVRAGAPKTRRSRRTVDIDAETVDVLKEWRRRQLEDERLPLGPEYDDQGLVFSRPDGSGVHPDVVTKRMRRLVKGAGLPVITPHGLRHTHATLLLSAGVHPKVVQERLGHSSIAVTIDLYSHVMPGMQADAAEACARLVDRKATG